MAGFFSRGSAAAPESLKHSSSGTESPIKGRRDEVGEGMLQLAVKRCVVLTDKQKRVMSMSPAIPVAKSDTSPPSSSFSIA